MATMYCPECGKLLKFKDSMIGKKATCTGCQKIVELETENPIPINDDGPPSLEYPSILPQPTDIDAAIQHHLEPPRLPNNATDRMPPPPTPESPTDRYPALKIIAAWYNFLAAVAAICTIVSCLVIMIYSLKFIPENRPQSGTEVAFVAIMAIFLVFVQAIIGIIVIIILRSISEAIELMIDLESELRHGVNTLHAFTRENLALLQAIRDSLTKR